jgi:hypothetical protein
MKYCQLPINKWMGIKAQYSLSCDEPIRMRVYRVGQLGQALCLEL